MQNCNQLWFVIGVSYNILELWLIFRPTRGDTFTIGYLTGSQRREGDNDYSRPGLTISGAITLAVEEVNRERLLGDHQLDFIVAETYGDESESIYQTAVLWTKNISVYIGPQETCVHEGRMAASFNLPMISYFCAHYETSDKNLYPTFARTRPPDTQISKSVASVLKEFNWHKIAFLYSETTERNFVKVAKTIQTTLKSSGIEIRFVGTLEDTYHHGYGDNPFDALVENSYQKARIYVVLGSYDEHLGLMMSMEKQGLLKYGEYFVVGVDIEQYDTRSPLRYMKGLLKENVEEVATKAFRSYIGIMGSPPIGFENFTVEVNKRMVIPPFNYSNSADVVGGHKNVPAEGAYLYDAVHVYAKSLRKCLENNEDPFNGRSIFNYIKGEQYLSAMGYTVYIDEKGDAEGNYTLIARMLLNDSNDDYGLLPVGVFQLAANESDFPKLKLIQEIDWINGKPPVDEPPCGFNNEKCVLWKIAVGITGGVAFVVLLLALVVYRNWAYEQELDSLIWKIDYKDIEIFEHTPTFTSGKTNRNFHPLMRTSQVSLSSNPDADFRYSTIYTQIGVYKGRVFAIKRFKRKSADITRKMKKELKAMRDLRHDNLNHFVGACIDSPDICIITEYCSRGSLKDILDNEDVKLDKMFISSLIQDIVRGMTYLHDSPIRSHGKLKSPNCLVDSRWVLKISDFGLHELKYGIEYLQNSTDIEKHCQKLLWTAPEVLRDPALFPSGTQKGDVYSFAIILYETVGRNGPYGKIEMSPSEIIQRVIRQDEKLQAFRPQLELIECPFDCIRECIKECWSENPDDRPEFKTIRTKLHPMKKGMKQNIFDNMLAMMEKYANNLEALVDERTDQLVEEKKKTEALLYEMLPKYVADQLKRGNKVEAESFDSVTIYFSDIVGFTTMSAKNSPLQVVDFLNDLYTCFDSIIENYDVYKVETIGDAYMVVSGLPIRNGDQHAGEIASMALHLLDAVKKFKIRHSPEETLMLRIGLHSGPVCAGVVGLKMPRYCLFGDTVNTASRMESTGLPLKIHCSLECKNILDSLGNYTLSERGTINIKGKGQMTTYWLIGEKKTRHLKKQQSQDSCISQPRNSIYSTMDQLPISENKLHMFESNILRSQHKNVLESYSCPCLDMGKDINDKSSYSIRTKMANDKTNTSASHRKVFSKTSHRHIRPICNRVPSHKELGKTISYNSFQQHEKVLCQSESEPFLLNDRNNEFISHR